MDEELDFHFEMPVDRYEARGYGRADAERRARERFGGMDRVRREAVKAESTRVRGERRVRYLDGLGRDVGYGLRTRGRNPSFAITAVLMLAVTIGANTAIFSAANAFLFQPLPFLEADHLVTLYETNPDVIGRTIDLGTVSLRVVGVMPRSFNFPAADVEVWTPWSWDPADRDAADFRRAHWVRPVARLKRVRRGPLRTPSSRWWSSGCNRSTRRRTPSWAPG